MKSINNKRNAAGAWIFIAAMILSLLVCGCSDNKSSTGRSNWEKDEKYTADKFMSVLEEKDYDKLIELNPDKLIKVFAAQKMAYDTDIKESKAEKQVRDSLKSSYKSLYERTYGYLADELGRGFTSSYEIVDKEKIDQTDVDKYNELIEEYAEMVVDDEIKDALDGLEVTKGVEITYEVTGKYKDDEKSIEMTLTVIKIDGKWAVVSWDVDK